MNNIFRATATVMSQIRADLTRPHPFAYERVGFVTVKATNTKESLILLAQDYYPVADADYLQDDSVGAMISQEGIRKALELALLKGVGVFHIHQHQFDKHLWFSRTDLREQLKFVPDFFKVRPEMPHGAVVLGPATAAGRVWVSPTTIENIDEFNVMGQQVSVTPTGGRLDIVI